MTTNLIHFVKRSNTYVFIFDDEHTPQLIDTLGRYAASQELSLSWYDAAILSQRVREMTKEPVQL